MRIMLVQGPLDVKEGFEEIKKELNRCKQDHSKFAYFTQSWDGKKCIVNLETIHGCFTPGQQPTEEVVGKVENVIIPPSGFFGSGAGEPNGSGQA